MTTHILEEMLSHWRAIPQPDQNIGNDGISHMSDMMSATTISPERRRETRIEYRRMCSYEMLEAIDEESVVIERGEALILNQSTEGMLLFMGQACHAKQLIEVHTPRSEWSQAATVFEVRWSKPWQVEPLGNLYLVGCQRVFGPCHELSL